MDRRRKLITIGIDPIIFTIGSFSIGWHGFFTALAVVVGVVFTVRLAKGSGIAIESIYSMALWAIPGGIVGARLVHVIERLDHYASDPVAIFTFWDGGIALFGAILGGALAGAVYAKLYDVPVGRLADLTAPGIILAQAVGRIGCTINGDAYGTLTSLPWGIVYTHHNAVAPLGVPGHPAPVYEMGWDLLVLAILWYLRGRIRPDGTLFLLYLSLYSLGRFFISFVRVEPAIFAGLHQAQIIALLVLITASPLLIYLIRQRQKIKPHPPDWWRTT